MSADLSAIRIDELLRNARVRDASDVHFGGSSRPALRVDGRLILLEGDALGDAAVLAFLERVLGVDALAPLSRGRAVDGVLRAPPVGPCRIHAYREIGGIRIAVRLLAPSVPEFATLHLPDAIAGFIERPQGLIVFTGPTGSGKTTALAASIDRLNRTTARNIVTIEDPIEYAHVSQRSLVTQCEIGRDAHDYAEALRGMMRADPDVLLVGEMRDRETMAAALSAAETGHLVLTTLHTNDAAQTIDRIVDAFPSEAHAQIRTQLAAVLVAAVSLRLVPRRAGTGRRAAVEVLAATDGVRNLIRDGKTHQLRNAIVTGRDAGMQTLEHDLSQLVGRGDIELDAALAVANRPADVRAPMRVAG